MLITVMVIAGVFVVAVLLAICCILAAADGHPNGPGVP